MRRPLLFPLLLAPVFAVWATSACSGGSIGPAVGDGGATGDAAMPPQTAACMGDVTRCLSGTAATKGMTATMRLAAANLFRVFPYGTEMPVQEQLVAKDGTWAFSGLDPWAHYYVQINGGFVEATGPDASTALSIAAVVGPLSVPSPGTPVPVFVKPAQLELYQTRQTGGQNVVAWASAHVFDPTTGAEILSGANVSVVVNGAPTPMPFMPDMTGKGRYYVTFSPPVAAAASYQITVAHPSFGSTPVSFQLAADPPTFDTTLTTPASGGSIHVGQAFLVSWPAQPTVDYELLELFFKQGSTYQSVYAAGALDGPDVLMDTIPAGAVANPGTYLLNVAFAKANCPASADGCVYGNTVGSAQLTAQ
jgi:hypothetical protein